MAAKMFVAFGSHISACGVETGNFVGGRVVATRGVVAVSLLTTFIGVGKIVGVTVVSVVGAGVGLTVAVGVGSMVDVVMGVCNTVVAGEEVEVLHTVIVSSRENVTGAS